MTAAVRTAPPAYCSGTIPRMRYDEFKLSFANALAGSGLSDRSGPTERLDLSDLDRQYEVYVEPLGGQDAEPFHVTAALSWRWDALKEVRTTTTEEDMLTTLFGRDEVDAFETEQPWLRVDVKLQATLPWGQPLAMPSQVAMRAWAREVVGRLDGTEPLLPDEVIEETDDGNLAILAWQGTPEVRATCATDGTLKLERVGLAAWQSINLPRIWDHPDRQDDGPEKQLEEFFARVRRALHVWMETLDHLVRAPRS